MTVSGRIKLPVAVPGGNLPYKEIISASDREGWLAARAYGIGASESSTILGLNPWESPFTLYQKKLGVIETEDNEPMEWGRRLEAAVAQAFSEKTGRKVWGGGVMLQSLAFPWLFATPDREQRASDWDDDGLLEVKTASAYMSEDWSEDVPVYYQVQLQHQLLVTGRTRGSVACLIGGQKFVWQDYERHDALCELLIEKTQEFWERVKTGNPPPMDPSESTMETLKHMSEKGMSILLPDEALEWHAERQRAMLDKKDAEERKEKFTRLLATAIGDASLGVLPGNFGGYTFMTRHVREYTVPAKSRRELRFTTRVE